MHRLQTVGEQNIKHFMKNSSDKFLIWDSYMNLNYFCKLLLCDYIDKDNNFIHTINKLFNTLTSEYKWMLK